MPLKISAFPKCYIDQIAGDRTMSVFDWIEMARSLDADGLEMYDGFFTSLDAGLPRPRGRGDPRGGLRHADALLLARLHQPGPRRPQAGRRPRGRADRTSPAGWAGRGPSAGSSPASDIPRSSRGQGLEWVVEWHQPGPARRPRARHRPGPREPLQGRLLDLPRVRPEDGRVPRAARRDPRPRPFRRAVRPVERDRRGRRPDRALAGRGRPGREHARQRPVPRRGDDARRPPPDRRHARLFAQPAARRHRQGPQRLRRHLPHPGRARLSGLDQHRGRHERHGRDGRVAGVPPADGREVLPGSEA